MSDAETSVLKRTQVAAWKIGSILLRNNRGVFYTMDGVKALVAAVQGNNLKGAKDAIRRLRITSAGLEAPGASDLAGNVPVKITPEMVGMVIAWPVYAEVKRRDWSHPSGKTEEQQQNFINQMIKAGACAFFINDEATFADKVKECLKNMVDKHLKSV